jgi:DTW domain-containing protein
MSTYEAVVQALAILEGEAVAGPLLDFYRRTVDRLLLVRGHIKLDDVYGGFDGPRWVVDRHLEPNNKSGNQLRG